MPKSGGARMHPCLRPLLMGKGSKEQPSCWTVPLISSCKEVIMLKSLGGGAAYSVQECE